MTFQGLSDDYFTRKLALTRMGAQVRVLSLPLKII